MAYIPYCKCDTSKYVIIHLYDFATFSCPHERLASIPGPASRFMSGERDVFTYLRLFVQLGYTDSKSRSLLRRLFHKNRSKAINGLIGVKYHKTPQSLQIRLDIRELQKTQQRLSNEGGRIVPHNARVIARKP